MYFKKHNLEFYRADATTVLERPLFSCVSAGFPSPADDYVELSLDLNRHLIDHPAATFFVRVSGNSMIDAGIRAGDILIVDRARKPKDNDIAICVINGDFTVKRLKLRQGGLFLAPANPEFAPIEISASDSFEIWGIVTYVIHKP